MVKQLFLRSGVYFSGLVFVKLISTVLFLVLARTLQPTAFGRLTYFLTVLSLLTLIADWGLIQWYQLKKDKMSETQLMSRLVSSRLFTAIVSGCIFIFIALGFQLFNELEVVLFLLFLFPEAFLSISDAYYLTQKQSLVIAIKQLSKYFLPIVFILILQNKASLTLILSSFLLSTLLTTLWYLPRDFFSGFTLSFKDVKETLKDSSSYATLIFASALYSRGDTLVINSALGNSAVGQYSAGYRYLDAMSMFPSAFSQNLFHLSTQKKNISKRLVLTMTAVMGVIGLAFGSILYFLSYPLTIGLLGKSYHETELVVKIFAVVTVLLFLNSPLSTIIQSSTLVKRFLPWGIANTVLNIVLNVLIVPMGGITAAAFVMLFTEATGLFINVYFVIQRLQHEN